MFRFSTRSGESPNFAFAQVATLPRLCRQSRCAQVPTPLIFSALASTLRYSPRGRILSRRYAGFAPLPHTPSPLKGFGESGHGYSRVSVFG